MRKIIRERRQDREWLLAGDPRPQWYMNFVIRREVGNVFFMGMSLLAMLGFYVTVLSRAMRASFFVWLLFSFCFFNAIYRIYTTLSEEYERRRVARSAGETPGRWQASFTLHRGWRLLPSGRSPCAIVPDRLEGRKQPL